MPNKYSRNAILQQNLKAIRLGHQSKKLILNHVDRVSIRVLKMCWQRAGMGWLVEVRLNL